MDVFEKFLYKICYKFPKGYPDLKDEGDVLILEQELEKLDINVKILSEKKEYDFLSQNAKQVADEIIDKFDLKKEQIKASSKNRIIILTDESRGDIFSKLEELGFERDMNISGSSQGGVKNEEGIEIIVKPLSKQGAQSAGKQNEVKFNELIDSHIKEYGKPITITFVSSENKVSYNNVADAEDASAVDASKFYKADTQLLDSKGKVLANISLKKRNAVRWESSKRRPIGGIDVFKSFIEKVNADEFDEVALKPLEKENKYKLYNPKTDKILSKVIIKNIPDEVLEQVVFGNDDPKTIVIKETFEGNFSGYKFKNGELTINCYKLYLDVDDVDNTDDEPVFAFSNHMGQAYGIEFRSFSKGLLYKDGQIKGSAVEIDFDDLK